MKHYILSIIILTIYSGSLFGQEIKTIDLPDGVSMDFIRIPKGSFMMGSDTDEQDRQKDEGPAHEVTISNDFYMGQVEVTQEQWITIMGGNPSVFHRYPASDQHPVDRVTWEDTQVFIAKLNDLNIGAFRLPTEAEWEYASRAGTQTRYSFGDDPKYQELIEYAWFNSRSEGRSWPVRTKKSNPWGLYGMHGSVWEWCADWYGPYSKDAAIDPVGPVSGENKVIRGGSWYNEPEALRSANRHRQPVDSRQTNNGFRLVMEIN